MGYAKMKESEPKPSKQSSMEVLTSALTSTFDLQDSAREETEKLIKFWALQSDEPFRPASKDIVAQSENSRTGQDMDSPYIHHHGVRGPLSYDLVNLDPNDGGKLVQMVKTTDKGQLHAELDKLLNGTVMTRDGQSVTYEEVALNGRGFVGESILHICFLLCTEIHVQLIKYLLPKYGTVLVKEGSRQVKFVDVQYTGSLFFGERCLHFAAVQNNLEMVRYLVKHGAAVGSDTEATGAFFKEANYYGGLVLSFAAIMGTAEMLDFLIESDADPAAQDWMGNTVLHVLAMRGNSENMTHMMERYAGQTDVSSMNAAGLTPLLMAARCQNVQTFRRLLRSQSEVVWKYGFVQCRKYPLLQLDSQLAPQAGRPSVLQLIVEDGNTELLKDTPILSQLLQDKWDSYAFTIYYANLVFYLLTLGLMWCYVEGWLGLGGAVVAASTLLAGEVSQITIAARQGQALQYFQEFDNIAVLLYTSVTITTPFQEDENVAILLVGCANVVGWLHVMHYLRASVTLGPLVVMVKRVIAKDIKDFALLSVCVLLGFSCGLQAVFKSEEEEAFEDFRSSLMTLFRTSLGDFGSYPLVNYAPYPTTAVLLWTVFVFLAAIILLNLLIAMMGDTYSRVASDSIAQWRLQFASAILDAEGSALSMFVNVKKRPVHHVPGKDFVWEGRSVPTWWMQVEETEMKEADGLFTEQDGEDLQHKMSAQLEQVQQDLDSHITRMQLHDLGTMEERLAMRIKAAVAEALKESTTLEVDVELSPGENAHAGAKQASEELRPYSVKV